MPVAYIPSPASGVWHLGMIPVRAYALCVIAAVVVGLWLTDRRYRRAGGKPGVILDLATIVVPVGLIGTRVYDVLTEFGRYFGPGRDWTDVLRVWDGGMGVAAAVAAGALAAWAYGRRTGVELGPVAIAAAPALAVAQAISVWGNWFTQELYGSPSGLPWAVAIEPQHRVPGYQTAATFQPLFLYESLLDLLVAACLAVAIRRYALSGGRAFALYAALWTAVGAVMQALRVDYSPHMFGLRINLLAMLAVFVAACGYLTMRDRRRRRPVQPLEPQVATASPGVLRPRSTRAAAGDIALGLASDREEKPPGASPGRQLQH